MQSDMEREQAELRRENRLLREERGLTAKGVVRVSGKITFGRSLLSQIRKSISLLNTTVKERSVSIGMPRAPNRIGDSPPQPSGYILP